MLPIQKNLHLACVFLGLVTFFLALHEFKPSVLWAQPSAKLSKESEEQRSRDETKIKTERTVSSEPEDTPIHQQKSDQRLMGEVNIETGASLRNENIQVNRVDNNAIRELNMRLGPTATIVKNFKIDQGYFGAEYGNTRTSPIHAHPQPYRKAHGDLFWTHSNSIFSARSFFQVGAVKPDRANFYGGSLMFPLEKTMFLTLEASQNKIRGNVNGNVLILLPEERTPLTQDPELASIVKTFLEAYPVGPPNRTDISERAHNTNSVQSINTDMARIQLDKKIGETDNLVFSYDWNSQNVDAFQFVVGSNPDTDNRSHRARVTWTHNWNISTVTQSSLGFDRLGTLLLPAAGAVGPVFTSQEIAFLGPSPMIPLDRVQNRFRYAIQLQHSWNNHVLTAGFSATKLQYAGKETAGHQGLLVFGADFGRSAVKNLRTGTPSSYWKSIGNTYRDFRNWRSTYYIGDQLRMTKNLSLNLGLRFVAITRPRETTGRSNLTYPNDFNNWGPRIGLAYRWPGFWGVIRSSYGLLYGDIFPVTFGRDRLNPPHNFGLIIQTPDLKNPLGDFNEQDIDPDTPSSWSIISPDLSTPYSHHYNLSWELTLPQKWIIQLGYVGTRSHKLFLTYFKNRAQFIEGIPFDSSTINLRRPDTTRLESRVIHNGSRAYFDAGRLSLTVPRWKSLSVNTSYWFSKALDIGGSYTNTSSSWENLSQSEDLSQSDLKGVSNFDQPHSFFLQFVYQTPKGKNSPHWLQKILGSWNFSAVTLLKSGTPFTVFSGSDAPGFGNGDGKWGDRPMIVQPSILGRTIGHPDESEKLLPRSAFEFFEAPERMRGNLGRNTFRKGRISNMNAVLHKTWALEGDWRVTFRAEIINLTNTPQFSKPGRNLTSPNFSHINNTLNSGRTCRFRFHFSF